MTAAALARSFAVGGAVRPLASAVLGIAVALGTAALLVLLSGRNPVVAYVALLAGAVGTPDRVAVALCGDGGFLYTANELATAVRHRIALVAVVFNDGAFGNVRRIQAEQYGNRLIACDLANPDFLRFAESFGAAAERAKDPAGLRAALRRAFARRDGPTLIEVPVGAMPSPWEFIHMPKVRG